ncbi:MAG: hypothetical protein AB7N91_20885 [Candidatus Tectimicrobiota bacterium]
MRRFFNVTLALGSALLLWTASAQAASFEMTPAIQALLEQQKTLVTAWAADPALVQGVQAQNAKGPLAGMDNARWKTLRRTEADIKAFQSNPAGQWLKHKLDASGGVFNEAFVNAAQGEKVAFVEKTSSYIHKGQPKFDVPFSTGKAWQGTAEFDESSQTYAIQIAVPVLADSKPIGVLVVGVNLSHLEKNAKP